MKLFALTDLCDRWNYTKAGIHKLTKQLDFPAPITAVCRGRIKLFAEADIQAYEHNKPWLFDAESKRRRQTLFAILQTAKGQSNPQDTLNKCFGQHAKTWEQPPQ